VRTLLFVTLMSVSAASADPSVNPSARIDSVEISRESILYWRLGVRLTNVASKDCHVTGYRFTDGAWTLDVKAGFTLPASSAETRYVRAGQEPPAHFSTSTRVELIATC